MPDIIERLRGTPPRISYILTDIDTRVLCNRVGDTWSIQENIGHLVSIEPLWIGRIDDILNRQSVLRDADLANEATFEANYNESDLVDIVSSFSQVRKQLVDKLESNDASSLALTSDHTRLKTPMRVVDVACFVAEHDDYHLARITYLMRLFGETSASNNV